jgi:hypothetical protein
LDVGCSGKNAARKARFAKVSLSPQEISGRKARKQRAAFSIIAGVISTFVSGAPAPEGAA